MVAYGKGQMPTAGRIERAPLNLSWQGEQFGVGFFATLGELYPHHAQGLRACATMERFNAGICERFMHEAGLPVNSTQGEKLAQWGAALARRLPSFDSVARVMIVETPLANVMFRQLGRSARADQLRHFANDLHVHECAMRDWFRSELEGKSDGGAQVFAYLERHGISPDGMAKVPSSRGEKR